MYVLNQNFENNRFVLEVKFFLFNFKQVIFLESIKLRATIKIERTAVPDY